MDAKPVQLELPLSERKTSHLRAGALRVKGAVKEAIKKALSNCELSREEVADELSRLTGESVSIHQLNNWSSCSKIDRRLPLELAGALSVITGDKGVLNAALETCGFQTLAPKEILFFQLGQVVARERSNRKLKNRVFEELQI